jgi:UDP-N-acetylmuramoylalanine--D-glutamate ligase
VELSVVVGLGTTGLSCVRYLRKQGLTVAATDTRQNPPTLATLRAEFPEVKLSLGGLDTELLLKAKQLIVSPGLSLQEPAIALAMAAGIPVIGDIELFALKARAPIVAITGSNAKGTVTTLVGEMGKRAGLSIRVGGNIGTPALDLLEETEPDFYVLEISSFQLETTHSLKAAAAVILNISTDHLDRHITLANYIAAKQRIYRGCRYAIYNRDDRATFPEVTNDKISFGLNEPKEGEFGLIKDQNEYYLAKGATKLLSTRELRIKGRHNWSNALAALALADALQWPMKACLTALQGFSGLPHRCEWLLERRGVHWYNDSKGTNVGATTAALVGLGSELTGKIILIAGGLGKGADFTPLQSPVSTFVRTVILFGQDAEQIGRALKGHAQIIYATDIRDAVSSAAQIAHAGDVVLLSPACASWDMFRNFEHRGEVYSALVRGLS